MSQPLRCSYLSLGFGLSLCASLVSCRDDPSGPSIVGRAIYAVTADNHLLLFGSEDPGTIVADDSIAGLPAGERILAVDFRPADQHLLRAVLPAIYLNATDSLGMVAVGKLADLVLLDANPLDEIRNTRAIRAVVANGRYFDRAALDVLWARIRAKVKELWEPGWFAREHIEGALGALIGGGDRKLTN